MTPVKLIYKLIVILGVSSHHLELDLVPTLYRWY